MMIKACARGRTVALQALVALAVLLSASACGSGGSTASSETSAATAAQDAAVVQQTCQQVAAVLTDGPDPGADPVGYAEAQILPLRQIRTSDATLGKAIDTLASAYGSYSTASGTSKTATATLTAAINRINSLCPGAGATP